MVKLFYLALPKIYGYICSLPFQIVVTEVVSGNHFYSQFVDQGMVHVCVCVYIYIYIYTDVYVYHCV